MQLLLQYNIEYPLTKNKIPVATSINGYLIEISFLHLLHLPLKSIYETKGILSYHSILLLQLSQNDLPFVMLTPLTIRQVSADINDPITNPNRKIKVKLKNSTILSIQTKSAYRQGNLIS